MSEQIKFEQAKSQLNRSLEELEDIILSKIPDKSLRLEVEELQQEVERLKKDNLQKDRMIKTLDSEVNNLQNSLSEIGSETEFLHEKNKMMSNNYRQKEEKQRTLLKEIIEYINQIEELVRNEN